MGANFDLFSTAQMLKAVEQMPRIYSFLADTFARDDGMCEDERALYDYRKGSETGLAPFVVPGTGGVAINRDGFEIKEIQFTTLAPERVLTLEDVSSRMFGEAVTGALTPEQRAKRVMARDLTELRAMVQARREWMVRELLLKGKLEIKRYTKEGLEKEHSLVANFGQVQTYTPQTAWDQAGAKIGDDMEKIFDLVYDGLGDVDTMVMGEGVFEAMSQANNNFVKMLDIDHVVLDEIRSHYMGQGVRYRGTNRDGVNMYSYSGHFRGEDRSMVPHIPKGWILFGSANNKPAKIMHGPINKFTGFDENASLHTYIKKEVPFRVGGSESDSIATRLVSRPTVMPENITGWAIAKVLTTNGNA